MKTLTNLLTSLIIAFWIGAIAIVASQNLTRISLKFLNLESIRLAVGQILAFSFGVGIVLGAIVPLFWQRSRSRKKSRP
ncbi:MAG: DUF1049 domain-containing protein [Moorea sp. SIO2B7]|nr:DUF1049 domain-containing protein [Moorena sp. SIO2B7]